MNSKVKPIIGRVGGKARIAPWIIEHLKRFQWSIYCEPFAGSAAVYFRMVQEGIFDQIRSRGHHPRIVLNDADSRITQLFRTCRDHPELLAYAVAMTPYSREEHKLAQTNLDDIEDEIELARQYLIDGWQSFAYMQGDSWGKSTDTKSGTSHDHYSVWNTLPQRILAASPHLQGEPNPVDSRNCLNDTGKAFLEPSINVRVEMARRYLVEAWQSMINSQGWVVTRDTSGTRIVNGVSGGSCNSKTPQMWNTIPQRILNATEHFKKCYIENDDAVKCINRWSTPHTCFYLDPPYIGAENYYAHNAKQSKDSNLDMHYRLAEIANTVEAATVVISYYPNELLDELYPETHWERHYKDTVASSAGITRQSKTRTRPKRTELLLVRKQSNTVSLSGQMKLFD